IHRGFETRRVHRLVGIVHGSDSFDSVVGTWLKRFASVDNALPISVESSDRTAADDSRTIPATVAMNSPASPARGMAAVRRAPQSDRSSANIGNGFADFARACDFWRSTVSRMPPGVLSMAGPPDRSWTQ